MTVAPVPVQVAGAAPCSTYFREFGGYRLHYLSTIGGTGDPSLFTTRLFG